MGTPDPMLEGDDALYAYLGAYLRNVRQQRKIIRNDLALAVGMSESTIRDIEKGDRPFRLALFLRMCQFLDLDYTEILDDALRDIELRPYEK